MKARSCTALSSWHGKESMMMTREQWLKWIEQTWRECQEKAWKEQ